jgi:hypothetical protein
MTQPVPSTRLSVVAVNVTVAPILTLVESVESAVRGMPRGTEVAVGAGVGGLRKTDLLPWTRPPYGYRITGAGRPPMRSSPRRACVTLKTLCSVVKNPVD